MATIHIPPDFKEFLKLLNSHHVEYLLVGGYAVSYHGYPRATADMDIWIAVNSQNAKKIKTALEQFGFSTPQLSEKLFLKKKKIIRMGVPPLRVEILTAVSGVKFEECYKNRRVDEIDGVKVNIINSKDLKRNKKASGRYKDLDDLQNLP